MLTPIDIQNHSLKTAVRGYSKKETDDFLEEIIKSYEEVYRENRELKDKLSSLSDGIQYYKGMESTLQKALVLAEKTSSETQEAAKSKAEAMTSEAEAKAEALVKEAKARAEALEAEANAYAEVEKAKAKQELEETRNHVRKLVQSYENYRLQFKKLAESQIEMLDSEHFSIFAPELDEILGENAPNADEAMEAEETVAINSGISSKGTSRIGSGEHEIDQAQEESIATAYREVAGEEESLDESEDSEDMEEGTSNIENVSGGDAISEQETMDSHDVETTSPKDDIRDREMFQDHQEESQEAEEENSVEDERAREEQGGDSPFEFIDT